MPGANRSTLTALLSAYLMMRVLKKHQADALYDKFAQSDPLPKNQGDTAKWYRYENLDEITSPVSEGVTPPPVTPRRTEVTCTVDQYIFWMPLTDQLVDLDMDSRVVQNLQTKLSETAVLGIDTVKGNAYTAGANVVHAAGAASRAEVDSVPTADDMVLIEKTLRNTYTQHITERIVASTKIATEPVRRGYIGIFHSHLLPHFRKLTGWVDAKNYPQNDAMPNEEGAIGEIRCLFTNHGIVAKNAATTAASAEAQGFESDDGTNANVYLGIVFGTDALGTVGLAGQNMKVIVKLPGTGGPEDPADQRGSVAIKTYDGEVILDDDYIVRYECCAEVNPTA